MLKYLPTHPMADLKSDTIGGFNYFAFLKEKRTPGLSVLLALIYATVILAIIIASKTSIALSPFISAASSC
ncbi:MAG: hypothetical protein ACI4EJ_10435, partial [Bacteroides sp.]